MEHYFRIEGRPKPKERPRLTRRGRAYTPKATIDAERHVAESYDGPMFTGPVKLTLVFYDDHTECKIADEDTFGPSALRGDIDNYVKTVQDGLQGVAYDNDRQVMRLAAVKQ